MRFSWDPKSRISAIGIYSPQKIPNAKYQIRDWDFSSKIPEIVSFIVFKTKSVMLAKIPTLKVLKLSRYSH